METGLNKRNSFYDLICMLPAFIFISSILLVRLHTQTMPMTDIYWTEATDSTVLADLFAWWKSVFIIIAACMAIFVIIVTYLKGLMHMQKSFIYIPCLIYVTFVLISLASSKFKYFAIHGMNEHFEGTFVLLAYMIMVVFLMNTINNDRRVKMIVYCVLILALLLGVLGITQSIGADFFRTTIGQKLITPNYSLGNGLKSWDMIDLLASQGKSMFSFEFGERGLYQTVYNPNYVPFYLITIIPLIIVLFCFFSSSPEHKSYWISIVLLLAFTILSYNFFAAKSSSGFVGFVSAAAAFFIVFKQWILKWWKPLLCIILSLVVVMILSVDHWMPEIKSFVSDVSRTLIDPVFADNDYPIDMEFDNDPGSVEIDVDYIDCHEGFVTISILDNILKVTRNEENGSFEMSDENGNRIYLKAIEGENGVMQILDNRFHDYLKLSLSKDNQGHVFVNFITKKNTWVLRYEDGLFLYQNRVGKEVPLNKFVYSSLISNFKFGSGRGLIWDTLIPHLKRYIAVGAGADCFAFVYPQNDYVTKYALSGYIGLQTVTDKAHNLYMQYWVNTGLPSLLAWISLVGYYLVGTIKRFRKQRFSSFSDFVSGGIFCGIVGFLFVALLNDGSVNTMPMFYTMLGTGLAINMKDRWMSESDTSGKKQASMPEI